MSKANEIEIRIGLPSKEDIRGISFGSTSISYPIRDIDISKYQAGDVLKACRELGFKVAPGLEMSEGEIFTVLRPLQEEALQSRIGSGHYDFGVPTAVYLPTLDSWLMMVKAADLPSGRVARPDGTTAEAVSNVFAVIVKLEGSHVQTTFIDGSGNGAGSLCVGPFLKSKLDDCYCASGLHDPRATFVPGYGLIITACPFNKAVEQQSMREANGDMTKPISGAYTEVFVQERGSDLDVIRPSNEEDCCATPDPIFNPEFYVSMGMIGPDFHFKNTVFFPKLFTSSETGEEYLKLLIRKMPGIQVIDIKLSELSRLGKDHDFRNKFWAEKLETGNLNSCKIMDPELLHEGAGNPNNEIGQLAPGMPPLHVKAECEGVMKDYWLFVYNSVPDFKNDALKSAVGRVINAALLDFENPQEVVSRIPHPIILPRTIEEFGTEEPNIKSRHADVAFCGGGGIDKEGKLVIFYTENDSIIRAATFGLKDLLDYALRFDCLGRVRDLSRGIIIDEPDAWITEQDPSMGSSIEEFSNSDIF